MPLNISEAVHKICLSLPEAEEVRSHGNPNFRVRGKTFATYAVNLHGDGRVALWLEAASGVQDLCRETDPEVYFVPPYVGPKGWIGVELTKGLSWNVIVSRVRDAYEKVAPAALLKLMGSPIKIKEPVRNLSPEEIDPLCSQRSQKVIQRLAAFCEQLPESVPARQFGNPVWKAGKKTYLCMHRYEGRLCVQVWVGVEQQGLLTYDGRYRIPPYMGHNGWIDLEIEEDLNWKEVENLVLASYRHFALQRMLRQLDA